MTRDDKIAKLNCLGDEWCSLRDCISIERKLALTDEVFCLAFDLFPSGSKKGDMMGEFFERYWVNFSSESGSLYAYMNLKLNHLIKKSTHDDREDHYIKNPNADAENEPKRIWVTADSLNKHISNDGEGEELGNMIAAKDTPDRLAMDATALDLISLILELPTRLKGKANNPQRLSYFKMFFTDSVVDVLHSVDINTAFSAHERDLFRAMHLGFLDFFMLNVCRTVTQIMGCPLKLYAELVDGAPKKEPDHPLPNDIYLTYLRTVEGKEVKTASTISEIRQAYRHFLEANLC